MQHGQNMADGSSNEVQGNGDDELDELLDSKLFLCIYMNFTGWLVRFGN